MIYALLAFIGLSIILGIKCMIEAGGRDAVELELLQAKKRLKDRDKHCRNMLDDYNAEVEELKKRDDWFAQVLAFHQKFNAPIRPFPMTIGMAYEEKMLRKELMREEVKECEAGIEKGDLVEIADGLADIIYIALGTAICYGIDLRPVFAEVHASNMRKVPWSLELAAQLIAQGKKVPVGKILKPIGWVGPQIAPILKEQISLVMEAYDPSLKFVGSRDGMRDTADKVVIE